MLRSLGRQFLEIYFKWLAKLALFCHHSQIIAIAGSANKYFFKEAILAALRQTSFAAAANPKDFNTLIGLPLAILDLPSAYHSYYHWLRVIFQAPLKIITRRFPDWLVLELGVSDPGEMRRLLSIVKPRVVVVTDLTQRYLEAFEDIDESAAEFKYLVSRIDKKGLVVLNYDNPKIRPLAAASAAPVKFFSLKFEAPTIDRWQIKEILKISSGQKITWSHDNQTGQTTIDRFGQHHFQAYLAGLIIQDFLLKQNVKKTDF